MESRLRFIFAVVINETDTNPTLLYGDVGEMHEHVVQLLRVWVVLDGAEATEAHFEQVHLQRSERGHQDVDPQVKLLTADQQGIVNISENCI